MNSKKGKGLQEIPGVGRSIEQDLIGIGINKVSDLKDCDPEKLYDRLCRAQGVRLDPCVLYTMRCAVYYASNAHHDPEKLKWWNWKQN
ncbi:MAG TPA: helix-hairpin-helix domain-containing protein [Patescibacteria group bacterium]|nr:helix-hairpin-helix domain-containing protein [Patescibacteria group bacterium]